MLKRWMTAILCVMMILCVTGAALAEAEEDEVQLVPAAEDPTVIASFSKNGVDVDFWRHDFTVKTPDERVTVSYYFDLPVLQGDSPAIQKINASLQKELDAYAEAHTMERIMEDAFVPGEEWNDGQPIEFWHVYELGAWPYIVNRVDDKTRSGLEYCGDGVISFLFEMDWNMGGVGCNDGYGRTYDLETGKELTIADLFPKMDPDKLLKTLQETVHEVMTEEMEDGYWGQETVDGYQLGDFRFFIAEDGELILCFDRYELAPGAAGSPMVAAGLFPFDGEDVGE